MSISLLGGTANCHPFVARDCRRRRGIVCSVLAPVRERPSVTREPENEPVGTGTTGLPADVQRKLEELAQLTHVPQPSISEVTPDDDQHAHAPRSEPDYSGPRLRGRSRASLQPSHRQQPDTAMPSWRAPQSRVTAMPTGSPSRQRRRTPVADTDVFRAALHSARANRRDSRQTQRPSHTRGQARRLGPSVMHEARADTPAESRLKQAVRTGKQTDWQVRSYAQAGVHHRFIGVYLLALGLLQPRC